MTEPVTRTCIRLGRALRLLLDASDEEREWRGSASQLTVIEQATADHPAHRFASVEAMAQAWHDVGPRLR
ncbi:hypothetical protein ACIQVC_36330 [Streptomyces sp. NPDC101112]|uniref:hypothetical protein n=1 Tax=Streptomyces sp. NPDC101112 TaxID=3366105 RepID=UPI003815A742